MYFLSSEIVENLLSLSASEEVATFEVENLQNPLGSKRWRSTGLTPYIDGQFEESKTIDAWGIWYCNARAGDQARLRLADTQGNLTAAPALDTGFVDLWPAGSDLSDWFRTGRPGYVHQSAVIAAPAAALWYRLDFDFTGNPDGYVQAGKLFLAERFSPGRAHVGEWKFLPETRAMYEVQYGAGGIGRGGGTYKRSVSFSFPGMSESDALGRLEPMLRERTAAKPVGAVLRESEVAYPMYYMHYGYLGVESITDGWGNYVVDVTITEP